MFLMSLLFPLYSGIREKKLKEKAEEEKQKQK